MATTHSLRPWELADLNDQANAIRRGLPTSVAAELVHYLDVPKSLLAEVLRIAPRTFVRRAGGTLKPDESERVLRLGAVFHLAIEVLGSKEAAQRWFQKPRGELGGHTPLSCCDTEPGRIAVERVLGRIDEGVYA